MAFLFTLAFAWAHAQSAIKPTDSLLIGGEVEKVAVLRLSDIAAMPSVKLKDIPLTNHKGDSKGKLEGLRGVPLKSVLQAVSIRSESPKVLSEYYLVLEATDGYKVVFSWNEVFNTKAGDHIFLLTEMAGKPLAAMDQRLALVTPGDDQTGRRYVKCLTKITIRRAE